MKEPSASLLFHGLLLGFLMFPLAAGEAGPSSTVLPAETLRLLAGEVNGFAAFNTVAMISTYHRTLGSDDTAEVLRRLQKKCENYGIKNTGILAGPDRSGIFWPPEL